MKKRWLAALMAAMLLFGSGCARHYSANEYQQVVDEVSVKYQVQLKVDLGKHRDVTPEQLRTHLETIARQAQVTQHPT